MTLARYRINELDAADRVVDGYSVMCRSDAAALAMASQWAGQPADDRLSGKTGGQRFGVV